MDIKKGFAIGVALGFAFGLGCATAATVIPPARAQSASVERWEYLQIQHGWDDGHWAAEAGAQGWEFVMFHAAYGHMIFKRRLP